MLQKARLAKLEEVVNTNNPFADDPLPRVAGLARHEAIAITIEWCRRQLKRRDITDEDRRILEKNIIEMTSAYEWDIKNLREQGVGEGAPM